MTRPNKQKATPVQSGKKQAKIRLGVNHRGQKPTPPAGRKKAPR